MKIGLGLVTYNRKDYFLKCLQSLEDCNFREVVSEFVVVNDGTPYDLNLEYSLIQHDTNKGVGISKNDALRFLLEKNCDYYFLIEDDILVKNNFVFKKYIDTSLKTGIHHFNYSQHGLMNKIPGTNQPNPKVVIDYGDNVSVALYQHCVGAFSFYTKKCLDIVGLIDEDYFNATEHLDHTYKIIKANLHPPFWWFADLPNANEYLSDIPWSPETSTISSKPDHIHNVYKNLDLFHKKHNTDLLKIPQTSFEKTKEHLKEIFKLNNL